MMDTAGAGPISFMHPSGSESMKVYCRDAAQKIKLSSVTILGDIAVEMSEPIKGYHKQADSQRMASSKNLRGVIKGVATDISDSDIAERTEVFKASRIRKFQNGRQVNTSTVLLIFELDVIERPRYVYIDYCRYAVHDFLPTPTRCYKCQAYGHIGKVCRATITRCPKCAGNHSAVDCSAQQPQCANCGGAHSAAYKGCPHYKEAEVVYNLASKQGLSYAAAVRRHIIAKHNAEGSIFTCC